LRAMLRETFQTRNALTLPVSGTGSAGMEAALCNLIEPGDRVLIGVNGFFGGRLAEMAARYGATVDRLEKAWGEVFTPAEVREAVQGRGYKLAALVHAETSTGVLQPEVAAIAEEVHRAGALLVLDCVTSLGGAPLRVDEWGVDVAYSGTQKCLSCPPGFAPITVSPRAEAAIAARKTPVANWYLELAGLEGYWGAARKYHHTVSGSMIYALHEALALVQEEGLEARWQRHRANAELLWRGLEALDLVPFVPVGHRLPCLTTVKVDHLRDEAAVRARLREEYNIEIAGGFGPLAGKVWRIGLMGFGSRRENVTLLLGALREVL
ncbi:MAG: alanine--glyoxylate aminotransferase family protein, partial [Chloroflexi bacterium]|nr:alanine--glyoxylate aminotransferase family protein [Chloroflexota bacterium]